MSAEPASQCKLLAVSLRLGEWRGSHCSFHRLMLLAASVRPSPMCYASWFLQTFLCLDFIISVPTRTLKSLPKVEAVADGTYGEITLYIKRKIFKSFKTLKMHAFLPSYPTLSVQWKHILFVIRKLFFPVNFRIIFNILFPTQLIWLFLVLHTLPTSPTANYLCIFSREEGRKESAAVLHHGLSFLTPGQEHNT